MPHPALSTVVARASRSFKLPSDSEATDGRLLTQFIQTKDESAFAELVRRFGPMVLGICRRITRDGHLAEDAFQAAFIVLARRANDVTETHGRAYLSPDGSRVALIVRARGPIRPPTADVVDQPWPLKVVVQTLDKPTSSKEWYVPSLDLDLCWAADGKKLIATKLTSRSEYTFENVLLDPLGVAWSPDGKRIAYTWRQLHADVFKNDSIDVNDTIRETEAFLMIADANGKNAKTIATDKAPSAINMILRTVDWR